MKLIALKIDVDNLAAIELGVPRLQQILLERQCGASFFWSLGREKNGICMLPARGLRRFSGAGQLALRARFGAKALCRGSLWPAASLSKLALLALKDLPQFEHGLRPAQNYQWQQRIVTLPADETSCLISEDLAQFTRLTGSVPVAFSAKSWQANRAVYRSEQLSGWSFASDTRGISPFWPVVNAEVSRCMQLPVTLPMLEEILPYSGLDRVDAILAKTLNEMPFGHVYNAAADFEGVQASDDFARLLDGWLAQGYQIVALGELYRHIDATAIAYHEVEYQPHEGRVGLLATQGRRFPN
ncbi:hypothetical protein [Deefgea rivuli]|uniref:hypothetical protein n=1 Tax=Deefgea rivuli TaxID=400948 RepID=UPI000482022F|nr:hypothetical protein [Deefgea rivuli]